MKYKVIGWTFYENDEIIDSGNTIGFAERNAIIDEIKKHKYLFSGWDHQETWEGVVPILNDGRKRCFSQRGWGGVMAEAYGHMEDFSYALFTFDRSIPNDKLHFAKDDFNIDEYEFKPVENEHFKVEVNEGLFEIAKKSNPFYLEDLDELRYIDKNDIITLCFNDEELTFVVKDINRDKAPNNLKNASELINGKYKIIVTHKPESERELSKVPLITSKSKAFKLFEEAMEEYNFDVIKEAIDIYDINYLTEESERKNTIQSLTRFVREYLDTNFKSNIIQILRYINSYKLYEEVVDKTFDKHKYIYVDFINYYLKKGKNMDAHILKFVDSIKPGEQLYAGSINILFKAITLKDSKSLRRSYYRAIKNSRYEGLSIMAGANLFKYLRKDDRRFIELDKYASFDDVIIREIVEYLTYPNTFINKDTYPYNLPKIYETDEKIVVEGIKAYQNYVKERFDLENMMEGMILHGIDKKCFEMEKYFRGVEYAAKYVFALDILTNFKYSLKEKALAKYASKNEDFKNEIEKAYSDL